MGCESGRGSVEESDGDQTESSPWSGWNATPFTTIKLKGEWYDT